MNWNFPDYAAAVSLIGSLALAMRLSFRALRRRSHRIAAMIGLAALGLLIWAELAVGLFD